MSTKSLSPLTSHFYRKNGVCRSIPIFAPKHRLWVLFRTARLAAAVLTCTHNIFLSKIRNKYQIFSPENFHFLQF